MGHARLTSIDAVDDLAAALNRFAEEAANALADLDLEVKRALEWLQHDRKEYWNSEVYRGWDRVAQARENLQRRMISRVGDERPSAVEEKKALEMAKRRLEIAQQKVEVVRHWSYAVQHELQEYVGAINQFTTWLQGDLPKAQAVLKRMSLALEAYVNVPAAPEAESVKLATAVTGEPENQAKPDDQAQAPASPVDEATRPASSQES